VRPDYFGNEVLTYGSPLMNLRLVKDRGQWSIDLGPTDLSGDWYDLEDVISVARGPRQKPLPPDLDSLAGALFQNLSEIQQFFANYGANRAAVRRAAERRSGTLLREIFPDFEVGEVQAPQNQRRSSRKSVLVEAVQREMGSQTSKADAERAVTAVINAIKTGVRKDKMVRLSGFGTFKVAEHRARKVTDPKTLEKIRIAKSKTVKFLPSKNLKSS
jgi:DNA-binding protein HU-beta